MATVVLPIQILGLRSPNVIFQLYTLKNSVWIKTVISVDICITYQIHKHGKIQADVQVSLICCFYQDCSVVFLMTIYLAGLL